MALASFFRMLKTVLLRNKRAPSARLVALTAILIATVTVVTVLVRVPIPATQGYFNFSDVVIYFVSFAFGPWVGLVAGGVGTALADLVGGFAQFAPITLFAHGLQGLVAGALGHNKGLLGQLLGLLAGAAMMIGIYYLAEVILFGWGAALAEVPANLLQNAGGGLLGIPLYHAVRKAYPPLVHLAQNRTWSE